MTVPEKVTELVERFEEQRESFSASPEVGGLTERVPRGTLICPCR